MSANELPSLTLQLINASNNIRFLNNNIEDLSNNLEIINNFLEDIYYKLEYDDSKYSEYLSKLTDISNRI